MQLAVIADPALLPYSRKEGVLHHIQLSSRKYVERLKQDRLSENQEQFYQRYLDKFQALDTSRKLINLRQCKLFCASGLFLVLSGDDLWYFGNPTNSRLGFEYAEVALPLKIPICTGAFRQSLRFKEVSLSATHVLAITNDERLLGWGWNHDGSLLGQHSKQTGVHEIATKGFDEVIQAFQIEMAMFRDKSYGVSQICAGHSMSIFQYRDQVFTSGLNLEGRLGSVSKFIKCCYKPFPVAMPVKSRITQVAAGYDFCLMLDSLGLVYGWGSNSRGQLALPPTVSIQYFPIKIKLFQKSLISEIACGMHYSTALTPEGQLFFWGVFYKEHEDLGRPKTVTIPEPNSSFCKVQCGDHHVLAQSRSGRLYGWGENKHHNFTSGKAKYQFEPVALDLEGYQVVDFAAGSAQSIFVLRKAGQSEIKATSLAFNLLKKNKPEPAFSRVPLNIPFKYAAFERSISQISRKKPVCQNFLQYDHQKISVEELRQTEKKLKAFSLAKQKKSVRFSSYRIEADWAKSKVQSKAQTFRTRVSSSVQPKPPPQGLGRQVRQKLNTIFN